MENEFSVSFSFMEVSVLQVERCAHLKAQLLECEERTRWMSTHTEELKQQLRHTQQGLLYTLCLFPVTYPSWTHAYLSVTVLCSGSYTVPHLLLYSFFSVIL